jgi:uncharacterized protein
MASMLLQGAIDITLRCGAQAESWCLRVGFLWEKKMGKRFAEIAFTPRVKANQELHDSRRQYQRMEEFGPRGDALGPYEQEFIASRDGFYMASVGETGWPYIQYRGGAKGFLHVLDTKTVGFADLRGNKQYISVGNLQHDDRVSLFLMDYVAKERLKIYGRAQIVENTEDAKKVIEKLSSNDPESVSERAILIHIEAFDWNCPQHITQRFTIEEIEELLPRN